MAKRWISSKQWSTIENSTTEYLVSKGANGNVAYETIPYGQTKKTLVSNGVGNVSWQNLTIPLPEGYGNMDIPNISVVDARIPVGGTTAVTPRTYVQFYGTLSVNVSAKRYETTQTNYTASSDNNYKLAFQVDTTTSTSNIENFNTFLNQMKKIEVWFKYRTDNVFYLWSTVNLDPTHWDHWSTYQWRLDNDYVTAIIGDFPGGTGNVANTGVTAYIVPFK